MMAQPPNPAMIMQEMQMQANNAKVQMAQMKLEVEKLKLEREKIKLQAEIDKIRMEVSKANSGDLRDKELSRLMDAMEKDRRYDLELERLRLEEARLDHQRTMDGGRLALDTASRSMEMNRQ
jgi:isopropylmalate/homocitrate/citramalate synthase